MVKIKKIADIVNLANKMETVQITICDQDTVLICKAGDNLYQVLSQYDLVEGPCGGMGCCGKCKVRILGDIVQPLKDSEATFFTKEETEAGWRLACLYQVEHDIIVELPEKQGVGAIVSSGYLPPFDKESLIYKRLDGEGNTLVWAGKRLLSIETGDTVHRCYGIAVDIGTTTVVATLVDLSTGEEMTSMSCLNGQKSFGQDVISRIHYVMSHTMGTEILQKTILLDLKRLFQELYHECGVTGQNVYAVTVAANTTMLHFLAGMDARGLGVSPYEPAFHGALTLPGTKLGLPVSPDCQVYCLPIVSAFIGGDITAGILACGFYKDMRNILFIDIGTNGEMVLSVRGRLLACSCAAGPALEGMNISCGTRAALGAVEDVAITGGEVAYETIGGGIPQGICGSGLLSAIAEMRRANILHESGRLQTHPLVEVEEGKKRFLLDRKYGIYLSQQDIRQVQLAKGAILSGIYALLEGSGLKAANLERVLVAGQFGAHLKASSLTGAGLIPKELEERITYVGNTSKSGAYMCLLSPKEREKAETIAQSTQYVELAQLEGYEDLFVKCMRF